MASMFLDPILPDVRWSQMDALKGSMIKRCEEYARLTSPYICPTLASEGAEYEKADVEIGPRLVNHLANKVVDTMFPYDRPFFAITLTPEARQGLRKEQGEEGEAAFSEAVRSNTALVEELGMRKMNLTAYRPQAVEAVKHLQITGNACIFRLPTGERVVYGVKDFCVRRDLVGAPQELMLRDATTVGSLPNDIQQRFRNVNTHAKDTDPCVLVSHYLLAEGRWSLLQSAGNVLIDKSVKYKKVDAPFLVLTWNLTRGEHYGRGHVEDCIVAFSRIDRSTKAMDAMIVVMADIKFLVDPASQLDPVDLNNSRPGSYHSGRKDDITTPESSRRLEIGVIRQTIADSEQELSRAFLMNSSTVRQAERVTAEEIRFIARELESAFGGLYSRLVLEWQQQEAEYAVSQIDFDKELGAGFNVFEVLITTGLESLSRDGMLQNMRMAIADLQMLDTVPEDIRATINPSKFAAFVFTNHMVKSKEFQFTAEEMQANQEASLAMAGREQDMMAQSAVKAEAGKQAIQET